MLQGRALRASISPNAARAELARRKLAERDLICYAEYVDPSYHRYRHHLYLAEKLTQVLRYIESGGKEGIGRLMILMPPQHGKSELASIKFPAWALGKLPDLRMILTSYGAELAGRNSKKVRDQVNSAKYQAVFGEKSSAEEPVLLSSDDRSATSWSLAQPHRGGVVSAGVGGAITGFGADLLIIDDLFKNREEAESEARRELVDDFYKSSAMTRLSAAGAVVIFFTHWHQDDQAGRLIKRMVEDTRADQWEIVCLPAQALDDYPDDAKQRQMMHEGVYLPTSDPLGRKPGEPLWPERYDLSWLENKRTNIGPYEYEALYQQMPYLRSGGFFKREWFKAALLGPGSDAVARIRYWDKAATPGGGDWTAGVLMSRAKDGIYYIEDICRGQWSPGERDKKMLDTGKLDNERYGRVTQWHQQDPASAGRDSAEATNAKLAEAGLTGRFEPVSGEKEVRAGPLSSAAEADRVRLVQGSWNEAFLGEAAAFPKGRNDDQIDAAASAFNKLRTGVAKPLPANQPTEHSKFLQVAQDGEGSKYGRYSQ